MRAWTRFPPGFAALLILSGAVLTGAAAQAPAAPNRAAATEFLRNGQTKFRTGDLGGALDDYNRAIAEDPTFAEAFYNRGLTRARQGELDSSIADFTQAIALNPEFADAYDDRCLAKNRKRDFDGAIADCTRAITLNPSSARAFNNRASVRISRGESESAIADLTRAVELNPMYAFAFYNRCRAETRTSAYDRAIEDCGRAISINPNYAAAYFARAQARAAKGDADAARTDYLAAHGLDPQYAIPPVAASGAPPAAADASDTEVVRPGNGVTLPRVIHEVKPQYTASAVQAQIQGKVLLECVVKKDGTVGDVRVVRSLDTRSGLDDEAIKAARQWRFLPGTRGNMPVNVLVTIELSFTLESRPESRPEYAAAPASVAAPLGWPRGFVVPAQASLPAASASVATLDREESDATIHLTYPAGWIAADSRLPGMTLLRSVGGTRGMSLRSQPSNARAMIPLSPDLLSRTVDGVKKRLNEEANSALEFRDFGQIRASSGTWVWFDSYVPAAAMANVPALGEIRLLVDGMEYWAFVTSTGSRLVEIGCFAVRPRRSTDAEFADQVKEAGTDCAGIVQSVAVNPPKR